jgi:AFG3 family protein
LQQTANTIDEEVRTLVAAAYERTLNLLTERKEECTKLAELLLSKETINVDDVVRLIGRRPFAYQGVPGAEYLKDSHTEQPKPENEAGTTPQPAL